jgi:N utilization substance protein B
LATRHQAREAVVGLIYAHDIGNEEVKQFAPEMLHEKKIFEGVLNKQKELEEKLNAHLTKWKMDEISNIERAILQLGAYEILYTNLDKAVIINEALELSKSLGSDNTVKLVNGILDNLK